MLQLNKKQIELTLQLRKAGRQPLTEVSKKINMPVSTIFDRLKSDSNNVIQKFTCLLNFNKLGFNCRAHMVFRIKKKDKDEMQQYLLKHQNVNSAYKINNGYDFLIETVFKELKELDMFMERIDEKFKVLEKRVYYTIEDVTREAFLTDSVHAKMVGLM